FVALSLGAERLGVETVPVARYAPTRFAAVWWRAETLEKTSSTTIFLVLIRLPTMDASFDAVAGTNRSIAEAFVHQRARLRGFIRKRVPDPADVEDILQEVFYELVQATRLVRPVEQMGAWLFTVARNRITDLFRKQRTALIEPLDDDDSALE